MERWKDIVGYEGKYMISDHGNVRSLKRGGRGLSANQEIILKPGVSKFGYKFIVLSQSSVTKPAMIHRLVALHFIDNPLSKRCVNHKNGIKADNHYSNLEWMTHSENNTHAYRMGLKKPSLGSNQYKKK